jgi:hypothetical protein
VNKNLGTKISKNRGKITKIRELKFGNQNYKIQEEKLHKSGNKNKKTGNKTKIGETKLQKSGNKNPETKVTKIRNKNYTNPGTKVKKIREQKI